MSDVVVLSVTQRIVVDPFSSSVSVMQTGPVGPRGPAGPDGDVMETALTTPDIILPSGALEAKLTSLQSQITALSASVTPTAWATPTLLNGWTNFGGSHQTARYRKIGDLVYVEGFLNGASKTGNTILQLPSGFRPALTHFYVCESSETPNMATFTITSAGDIVYQFGGDNSLSLAGTTFPTS
jgi:hypothetical protein